MKRIVLKAAVWTLVGGAVLIQFVPIDRSSPPVTREIGWDSDATQALANSSCYDCHSNETRWPWYSSVAPVSWLVAKDVDEGREHLNFSTWDRPNHGLEEIMEALDGGEMPPKGYALMHPEARLTDETRAALLTGFRATLTADPPVSEQEEEEHGHD